ncbi:MAG TPA: M14 family metallopeptidase [Pyrinomonadaceae bacterium]|nr:M14 family metallopeptidase [Pyrinomonadaceae bacterium]
MAKRQSPKSVFLCVAAIVSFAAAGFAQVPSPNSVLGFTPGDDRKVADWKQIVDYFQKLDQASSRVLVKDIGRSTNGAPLIVAFISDSANIKKLDKYRQINARLADPRTISSEEELSKLVKDGKAIVAISCSIHSTEIVASQMSMNLAFELATAKDPATKEILDNTILLLIPSPNPDGIQIVADWYKKTLGTKSEGTSPPELYHHYAGHDDNRDWFMMNLVETRAVTKLFWQEWFPEVVYDVHQQGQNSSRFIIPPFYDPINPRIAPTLLREVGLIGYKMAADLEARGIKGVATNSTYDTWWHGGFRSAPYYHNSIGILSEAASVQLMSPVTVKLEDLKRSRGVRGLADLTTPMTNYPDPWLGGEWRAGDVNRIEMIASRGLLSLAAKYRERYLRNFYGLGKMNLEPNASDPQAFYISREQTQPETANRFIEILRWQGIEVRKVSGEFPASTDEAGKNPSVQKTGWIVFVDQPQRNNVLSLFERQEYPHRLLPNGDAEVPYDVAGWTLPLQMGVKYSPLWRIADVDKLRADSKLVEHFNDVRDDLGLAKAKEPFANIEDPLRTSPRIGLYRGFTGSMDEGWTRLVLDTFSIPSYRISNDQMREGKFDCGDKGCDSIILPSDSENSIIKGLPASRYAPEFVGGIGEAGVENLKKFVEGGGRIVCFDRGCDLVVNKFALPVKDALAGLKRSEFYNPGSIVKLNVDTDTRIGRHIPSELPAYFASSSAYELPEVTDKIRVIARYAENNALLSGWMLGEKYLNGKAAVVEVEYGKGSVVLFGFRPQHRGQSWATFPLIFNSLEKN